jgi:hypothetical protein
VIRWIRLPRYARYPTVEPNSTTTATPTTSSAFVERPSLRQRDRAAAIRGAKGARRGADRADSGRSLDGAADSRICAPSDLSPSSLAGRRRLGGRPLDMWCNDNHRRADRDGTRW